ncbi:MAG: DsrE family protein [Phycisphaerae bacterium]|nr:DsrE family protein [Phycisphaerae bacterium]
MTKASRLAVVWSSDDPDVANRVCFMYTYNAKKQKWIDEVTLIVWGPSANLLANNEELQAYVKKMIQADIKVQACVACANSYGVSDKLRSLGIEVKPMGVPLSNLIKDDWKVITF